MALSIGELARRTGAKVQTIRYYEQAGLMPEPERTRGGQRRYGDSHARRLAFIRHARALGFSLQQIRALLDLADHPEQDCTGADSIAREHLREVKARIAALQSLKRELTRMVEQCDGTSVSQCRVIETLADHTLCAAPRHQPLS